MKRRYILLPILCLFAAGILAQPGNDDCNGAIELTDLDDFCDDYATTAATYDVINGNCVNPPNTSNSWFTFTARGTEVDIVATPLQGGTASVSIGEFIGGDCVNGNWNGLACDDQGDLTFDGLVEGHKYYVILSFQNLNGSDIRFCLDNPEVNPPTNDGPCDAVAITPDGSCESGTTVDATLDAFGEQCALGSYEQTVWYETTISAENNTLSADLDGFTGTATVMIVDFPNDDCNAGLFTLLEEDCGTSPLEAIATVTEGEMYWIVVTTSEVDEGPFNVCLTESGPPPGCSENDVCSNAEDFGTIVANDAPSTCLVGCNIESTGDIASPNCIDGNWSTVFFSFTTDALSRRVTIDLNSDDMETVSVGLLSGCNTGTFLDCAQGGGGSVSLDGILVQPYTTYIIIVGSPPTATGHFDLCVQTFNPPGEYCVGRDEQADSSNAYLEVTGTSMGSPPEGPYKPGEEVSFEFYVPNYSLTNSIQWLQAIIPVFGSGWDPASFQGSGEPVITSGVPSAETGTWDWYLDGDNDYNGAAIYYTIYTDTLGDLAMCYYTDPNCPNTGITADEGLPAGWYAFSPGGSAGCKDNGDPDDGWGDGKTGSWTVTFTLKARPFEGSEGYAATGFIDCSVKMFTLSDEQVGCWEDAVNPNACAGDEYKSIDSYIQCPEHLQFAINNIQDTVCSGGSTNIKLSSALEPLQYHWTIDAPLTITGAAPGSGSAINQEIINKSDESKTVTYNIHASVLTLCKSPVYTEEVVVRPGLTVTHFSEPEACKDKKVNYNVTTLLDSVIFSWNFEGAQPDSARGSSVNTVYDSVGVFDVSISYMNDKCDESILIVLP